MEDPVQWKDMKMGEAISKIYRDANINRSETKVVSHTN